MKTVAWESEEAKRKHASSTWIFKNQPVALPTWIKFSDHPIEGLAVYEFEESEQKDPSHSSQSKDQETNP